MPAPETNFDLLRPGVLLSEHFKLLERIPRWVAGRRFLADHSGKRVQLLFFEGSEENLDAWKETLPGLISLDNKSLLPVLSMETVRGFHFIVAEEVRGPCLRTLLDEEGVLAPEDARDVLAALRDALRCMQQAGIEAPALVPESILLEESGTGLHPVLFPWALPGYPATPPGEVSRRLRDLLYTATTNLEAPASFSPRDLLALPAPVRRHWQAVFEESPDWKAIDSWNPSSIRAQLPPERPLPPARPGQEKRPSHMQRTVNSQAVGTRPLADAIARPRTSPAWPVISTIASLAAAAAVIWFAQTLVESLRNPSYPQEEDAFPAQSATDNLSLSSPASNTAPAPVPPSPGNAVGADAGHLEEAAAINPSGETNPSIPPSDPSGEPGANLMVWYERWQTRPDDAEFTEQFSNYIRTLSPHTDAIRSGRMPALLKNLETVAKTGPPASAFLLGQILWGRETQRSEQIMKKVAREGYEPARAWCDEQFIDWE